MKKKIEKFKLLDMQMITPRDSFSYHDDTQAFRWSNIHRNTFELTLMFKEFKVDFNVVILLESAEITLLCEPANYQFFGGNKYSDISHYITENRHWRKIDKKIKDRLVIILEAQRLDDIEKEERCGRMSIAEKRESLKLQ